MNTIKDVFADYKQGLSKLYEENEAEAITLLVLSHFTGFSNSKIKAFPETALSAAQIVQLHSTLTRLKTGEPVQYILGETEFYGLTFKVNPSVLIPRPETEELVEWVINSVNKADPQKHILDIGTGSGCIAISLKKNLPQSTVTAIDISPKAIETAKANAELNKVDINFIEADILNHKSNPKSEIQNKSEIRNPKSEIIISNPPYVTLHDKTQMHTNVTDFEPHTALFVPKNDPLIFYKAITGYALEHLSPGGMLFFEINEVYGKELVELLTANGFKDVELRKDMSGRDRMIKASFV